MGRIAAGSVTNPMMRASPPQRAHTSTSTRNTSRNNSAHRRRRARSAGQLASGSTVSGRSPRARASTMPRRRRVAAIAITIDAGSEARARGKPRARAPRLRSGHALPVGVSEGELGIGVAARIVGISRTSPQHHRHRHEAREALPPGPRPRGCGRGSCVRGRSGHGRQLHGEEERLVCATHGFYACAVSPDHRKRIRLSRSRSATRSSCRPPAPAGRIPGTHSDPAARTGPTARSEAHPHPRRLARPAHRPAGDSVALAPTQRHSCSRPCEDATEPPKLCDLSPGRAVCAELWARFGSKARCLPRELHRRELGTPTSCESAGLPVDQLHQFRVDDPDVHVWVIHIDDVVA
jgi:hypothetical protein